MAEKEKEKENLIIYCYYYLRKVQKINLHLELNYATKNDQQLITSRLCASLSNVVNSQLYMSINYIELKGHNNMCLLF